MYFQGRSNRDDKGHREDELRIHRDALNSKTGTVSEETDDGWTGKRL
jgi:hypothetical protein